MSLCVERRSKSASELRLSGGENPQRRRTILTRSPALGRAAQFSSLPRQPATARTAAPPPPSSLEPTEFRRRLEEVRGWLGELSSCQLTALLAELLPHLAGPQLHFLSSQLPGPSPGLHHLCPPGCSDPLSLLPPPVCLTILGLLGPADLAATAAVCSTWRQLSRTPSLWRALAQRPAYRLSPAGCLAQLGRWRGERPDWRQIFVERFKLRRAWMGGQCHVRTFEGHSGGISCVQFDGNRIVSGSHDKTIKVWNVKTNSPWSVITLAGHSGEVRCLHLDGNRLVSGSTDLTIKVWDLSISVAWSSIACRVTMQGHTETVRCVQMDVARDRVISGSYDTTVRVWQLGTGAGLQTLRGHTGPVLALRAADSQLVTGGADRCVRVWDLDTGYCSGTLEGHGDAVTCLTVDWDKQQVISGSLDRTIKVWSIGSRSCINTLDWISNEGHTGVIRCLQADHWRILSAADDKVIKVWNLQTGQRFQTLKSHTDGVTCLQFNDFYIVSGSYDKTVKLWDFTVC